MFIEEIIKPIVSEAVAGLIILSVARHIEKRRFRKDKQNQIFKTIFNHRFNSTKDLDKEFVEALNLVYIEFFDYPEVIDARRKLQDIIALSNVNGFPDFDPEFQIKKSLLSAEMASILGIKISEKDIMSMENETADVYTNDFSSPF